MFQLKKIHYLKKLKNLKFNHLTFFIILHIFILVILLINLIFFPFKLIIFLKINHYNIFLNINDKINYFSFILIQSIRKIS